MPATYAAYPTEAELSTFISGAGVTVPSTFSSDVYSFTAINEWERLTNYNPFLGGSETTYKYDPPGPNRETESRGGGKRLFLDRGFVSISEVKSGVTVDDPTGTVLVVGVDYRLWPTNADTDLKPFTIIDFVHARFGEPNSIRAKGKAGYAVLLNADQFQAVLEMGAAQAMAAIQAGISSDTIDWTEGDVKEKSSVELVMSLGKAWRKTSRATAATYRRWLDPEAH